MENFNLIMRHLLSILSTTLLLSVALSCEAEISIYPEEPVKGFVLDATFAGANDTKTELGRVTSTHTYAEVVWSENDALSLFFNATNAKLVTSQSGLHATFAPEDPGLAVNGSSFIGLYPYDASASASGNVVAATLPAVQTAKAGSFDPAAMLSVGSAGSIENPEQVKMDFYNLCSGICFTLTSNAAQYKKIVFKVNGKDKFVAGPVSISLASPSKPAVTAGSGASDKVELLPPEGGFVAGKDYYICILPQKMESGFSMYFCPDEQQLPSAESCSASLEFEAGRFARINEIDKSGKISKIRSGKPLDINGTANCYVVSEPGCYKFPMVKGNDSTQELVGVTRVEVLWETDNTTTAPAKGSIINNEAFNGKYIYFDTPATIKDGNALIAAYSGDDILWSWHIWVCADDPTSHPQRIYDKPHYMLDRNLGALKALPSSDDALCNGLLYQWGRKDPFPGAAQSYSGTSPGGSLFATTAGALKMQPDMDKVDVDFSCNTLDYSIKHPEVFIRSSKDWLHSPDATLWAESKTIYDPCPVGWKIPNAYKMENKKHVTGDEAWSVAESFWQRVAGPYYGMYFTNDDGLPVIWYPNAGYLGCDGVLYMLGNYCCYWSYTISGSNVYTLELYKNNSTGKYTYDPYKGAKARGEGNYVRCIEDK